MLTQKQKAAYLKDPNACPYCGSPAIDSDSFQTDDNTSTVATSQVKCQTCGKGWQETFTLTSIHEAAEPYEIGATVIVPEPDETDIHQHGFTGTLIGYRNGYAQVQDGDQDVFEIEPERLIEEL